MSARPRLKGAGHACSGGFTLTEMMVVVAISSFVLATALSTITTMTRELKRLEGVTLAADEAKRLGDHLATELIATGGGLVRPWSALALEDGWSGTGSDRLTFAVAEDLGLQCTVANIAGAVITIDNTAGICCLNAGLVGDKVLVVSATSPNSPFRMLRHVTAVDTTACTATTVVTPITSMDQLPGAASAWVGGVLAQMRVRRIWLDEASDLLMIDEDRDDNNTFESRIAADRVFDLQVSLGYDVPEWDWHITDLGNNADEWRFNAAGDTFGVADGQGLAAARVSDLRMVRVGLIVGAPNVSGMATRTEQLLNGPTRTRPGWLLRSQMGTTGLRNYDIMR